MCWGGGGGDIYIYYITVSDLVFCVWYVHSQLIQNIFHLLLMTSTMLVQDDNVFATYD